MEFIYCNRVNLLPYPPGYQNGPLVRLAHILTLLDFQTCLPINVLANFVYAMSGKQYSGPDRASGHYFGQKLDV